MASSQARTEALVDPLKDLRDTAKWLLASLGAVGAILVAGSQLSSIGKLDVGHPWDGEETYRFAAALIGLTIALVAVGVSIKRVVDLLVPQDATLGDLKDQLANSKSSVAQLFAREPAYLEPYGSVAELERSQDELQQERTTRTESLKSLKEDLEAQTKAKQNTQAKKKEIEDAETALNDTRARLGQVYRDAEALAGIGAYLTVKDKFKIMVKDLVVAAAAVAVGTTLFAWAANPEETATPKLSGAKLTGAVILDGSLEGVDLTEAVLKNADLSGTSLKGAAVDGVTWTGTRCPDGHKVKDDQETCSGHLVP
jgi:hypothetical protein